MPCHQDPSNSVMFFPDHLDLEPGPASIEVFPISVIAIKVVVASWANLSMPVRA